MSGLDFNDVPSGGPRPYDPAEWAQRVEKVRTALRGRAREFVSQMYPYARIQRGQARMGSIRGDKGDSFVIECEGEKAGLWHEFAPDGSVLKSGGDLIDLWMLDRRCDFPTALAELEQHLGLTNLPTWGGKAHRIAQERQAYAKAHPPEPDAEEVSRVKHLYQSADGKTLLAVVHRLLMSDGSKTFRQQRQKADGSGLEWGSPEMRPLYRLPQIVAEPVVVMVEGEKCAERLADLGVPATTVMGGSSTILDKTDFSPIAGKTVILWPDNDKNGQDLMAKIGARLLQLGCLVKTVAIPPEKPEKWDAADAEDDECRALLASQLDQVGEIQPSGSRSRFLVTMYGEIAEEHTKTWLVDDFMGLGEMFVVYGAPGCGKSVLMGDLACHVAAGLEWFGHRVRECSVLYVAAERAALVKRRFAAWRKQHGILDLPLAVVEGLFDLASGPLDADEVAKVMTEVEAQTGKPVGWVIVDTKAQVMGGTDENSAKDVSAFVNNLSKFQARGATVAVVDHTPHTDPGRMRGSSALAGAADGTYLVQKGEAGGVRSLSVGAKPPNDGPDDFSLEFELASVVLGFDEHGKATTAPVVIEAGGVGAEVMLRVGLEAHQVVAIQAIIGRGEYRFSDKAESWAGHAVGQALGYPTGTPDGKREAAQALANLLAAGLLVKANVKDGKGVDRPMVKVGRRVRC